MAVELGVVSLQVRGFRNLTAVDLKPGPRFNVISGDNGQGKTSLLEALYVLCTSRSFRIEKLTEVIQAGNAVAVVSGQLKEAGVVRRQRASVARDERQFVIDDKPQARLSDYATRTPVVVFQPGDLQLISGSAAGRRKLLDRVSLFLNPLSMDHRQRFASAQRERQRLLDTRGSGARELDAYERVMAKHGTELERMRLLAAEKLQHAATSAFERLGDPRVKVALRFAPGGPYEEEQLRLQLYQGRSDDQRRKSTRIGPHKDDLEIELDHRLARRHASQGQQRMLALALKLAELECLCHARGAFPLLLLDDVSSELDHSRTNAVYDFLKQSQSQVFLTTTRPELFSFAPSSSTERCDFRLEQGALRDG
ncbi:MAG TPA: DNA replication and repair protein RecF [Polyangiaceae bacterium]|nr:DNA replication and repair protein RecF [Polyangiaceae bacterium]